MMKSSASTSLNTSNNNHNNAAFSSSQATHQRHSASSPEDSVFLVERMRLARKLRRMKRRLLLEVAEQRVPSSISFDSQTFREEDEDNDRVNGYYPDESYLSSSSVSSLRNGMGESSSSISMCSSALSTVTE